MLGSLVDKGSLVALWKLCLAICVTTKLDRLSGEVERLNPWQSVGRNSIDVKQRDVGFIFEHAFKFHSFQSITRCKSHVQVRFTLRTGS